MALARTAQEIVEDRGSAEVPLWIDGEPLRSESDRTIDDLAPGTGELFARFQSGSVEDVRHAAAAGSEAAVGWAAVGIRERAQRIVDLADRLMAHSEILCLIDALDTGSPIRAMRADVAKGIDYLRLCAGVAAELKGQLIPASPSTLHFTVPEPWGVVGAITAYNHPILFACQKTGPALLAGNAVVLKASHLAPLSSIAFAFFTDGILPPGVLNVVTGGPETGQALVRNSHIPRITFTGSVSSGLAVQDAAASSGTIKHLTLELGGKNPMIVFPDMDPKEAALAAVRGMNFTRVQGQSCGSTSRLLLHVDIHHETVNEIVELVSKIRLGLPDDEETEMGSLISTTHQDRVLGFVAAGNQEGATLAFGGDRPRDNPDLERGAYVQPTVFDDVKPNMTIAREEIFGPVLSVLTWTDEEEAVRLANDTDYGLTASIWTHDIDRALRTAARMECGYVWINDVESRYPGVPFGGWKQSGVGTEQGLADEIASFTRNKSVNIRVRPAP
ncbi:MAG: aldehyde dehydrogenase family protein [Acidimicrobiia bacterium]